MKVRDKVLHERQVFAYLDEAELKRLLIEAVAKVSKIEGKAINSPDAVVSCNISFKATDTRGSEPYAEVRITIPIMEVGPAHNTE